MQTAVINFKTEPNVKKKAQQVAKDLGFSLSSLLNAFLKQLIRDRTINFEIEIKSEN